MTLLGFAWTLAGLPAADAPLVFTAGIVLGSLWGPVLAHALLGFPSGRLATRGQRVLVVAAYVVVPLAPVPAMLFTRSDDLMDCVGPCPENLLLVRPDARLGDALLAAGSLAVMALALIAVGLLAVKWRAAGPAERRGLAPLIAVGGAVLLCVVLNAATESPVLEWLTFVAFAVTPFAFVGGLARTDVLHSRGVRTLVGRLADLPRRENLRDALATALGDPTLRLAFWVPEQGRYVDAGGVPAELPAATDPDVAVTEIARDGRRVAAIVHDRALCDDPETVRAVGAATALLLENQRLEAELRARIVELRASRARLVEAGDTERRRLERNLHDGAQSRLVALALDLRLARARFDDGSAATALVDRSIDEVRASLDELRELARGIHPAVLSDRGLEPAVRSLAARAPVPVDFLGAPDGRLPAAVETAAYYVVSEALTNVAKYSRAEHATVRMERVDGRAARRGQRRRRRRRERRRRLRAPRAVGPGRRARRRARGHQPAGRAARGCACGFRARERRRRHPPAGRRGRGFVPAARRDRAPARGRRLRRRRRGRRCRRAARPGPRARARRGRDRHPHAARQQRRGPARRRDHPLRAAGHGRARALAARQRAATPSQLLGESAAGAGYLLKQRVMEPDGFADAVREVAGGGSALDPEVVTLMLGRRRPGGPIDGLTPVERDVLAHVAEGQSNRAIATGLHLSEPTLARHLTSVFTKLGLPADAEGHRRVLAALTYLRAQEG